MNKIANRKKELNLLEKSIDKKHIDTYGNLGIGKTAFLHSLCGKISCGKYLPIHVQLIKVSKLIAFLDLIAKEFDEFFQQENYFFTFRKYIYSDGDYDIDKANVLFGAALNAATESISIALCFDGTEKVPCSIWEDFEENILRFHIEIGEETDSRLRIITAGQKRRKWTFFRMKKQVEACCLDSLDRESTKEMVQLLARQEEIDFDIENSKTIIDDIYSLTIGHPKSIKLIIQYWKELQVDNKKYQEGIAALLIEKYIQPEFIDQAKGLIEDEHYPSSASLLSLLQHLAPLRFISTKLLREALSHLSSFSSFYSKKRSFFFSKLLRALQGEHLLDWNEDRERYEFPAIVRHILLEDLKQNKTENLIKLHQEIERVYQKLTFESVVDRHADFIAQLYHTISWQEIDNAKRKEGHDLEETLWNEIDKYLKKYGEDAISLRSLLEADDYFNKMMNWEIFFRSL